MEEEQPMSQVATPDLHQVMVGGQIIYEGTNWVQAFLEAGRNPAYREQEIVHLINDKPGARLGPVLVSGWGERKMQG